MIKRYKDYRLDTQIDSLLNESMVYFSPTFRDQIKKIDSPITKEILDIEGVDIKDDISFIDIGDSEGMITFKTMKNFKKKFDEMTSGLNLDDTWSLVGKDFDKTKNRIDSLFGSDHIIVKQSRNPLKIGRFVNTVFPGKFSQKEIEEFTNRYKAIINKSEEFIIVEGDEIAKWYNKSNYYELKHTLGSSCMKNVDDSFFEIYTKNPEVCRMVCVIKDDKLLGRALLWKPNFSFFSKDKPSFEYFMDRQYAVSDSIIQKMRDYAEENGWSYKTINSNSSLTNISYGGDVYRVHMEVQLNKLKYRKFPYVDTFRKYNPHGYILINDDDENDDDGLYLLNSTSGGFEEISSGVWSDYLGENIDRDYVVWSDAYNSYLHIGDSIEVTTGSRIHRDWYPNTALELRYDYWNDCYIHEEDAIYSEEYGAYILTDESISIVIEIKPDGDCYDDQHFMHIDDENYISYRYLQGIPWFDKVTKQFSNSWDSHNGVLDQLLKKVDDGIWIPTDFSEIVYKVKENIWLTEVDMEILGLDGSKESKEMDKVYYSQSLIDNGLINELISKLSKKIRTTNDDLYFEKNRLNQLIDIEKGKFPDYSI